MNLLEQGLFSMSMYLATINNIFRKKGVEEKPNLQKDGNKAKPYQVKQIRNIILKYRMGDEE